MNLGIPSLPPLLPPPPQKKNPLYLYDTYHKVLNLESLLEIKGKNPNAYSPTDHLKEGHSPGITQYMQGVW